MTSVSDILFDVLFTLLPTKAWVAILGSAALIAGALYLWAYYG